jgi:hypothetical protein
MFGTPDLHAQTGDLLASRRFKADSKSVDEAFEQFYPEVRPTEYSMVGYKLGERIV